MLAPVPHWLTPREQDVAVLLARGLSTSEIARQLVLFPATVTTHVDQILRKLGFQHRVQIARQISFAHVDLRHIFDHTSSVPRLPPSVGNSRNAIAA